MAKVNIGNEFKLEHAAGVTLFKVDRPHRDYGYFECVAVAGLSGTHHFIGSIQVLRVSDIERLMSGGAR